MSWPVRKRVRIRGARAAIIFGTDKVSSAYFEPSKYLDILFLK